MGRRKEFDPESALQKAMLVFWEKGFEATSMEDLTTAMGIRRGSLYDTFGNKRDLFLDAVSMYNRDFMGGVMLAMEAEPDPVTALSLAIDGIFAHAATEHGQWGCFLTNIAVELGPKDSDIREQAVETMTRFEGIIAAKIEQARANNAMTGVGEPRSLARFILTSFNGIRVVSKVYRDQHTLNDIRATLYAVLGLPTATPTAS